MDSDTTSTADLTLRSGGAVDRRLTAAFAAAAGLYARGSYSLVDRNEFPLANCLFWPYPAYGRSELAGRQAVIHPAPYIGLLVGRKIFVPTDGKFARYLEALTNPTTVPHTVPVMIKGTLTTGTDTRVYVAPSATANTYAVTDSNVLCCSPAVGHVFGGPNASTAVTAARFVTGNPAFSYQWNVTVPPGQTVILMHFATQRDVLDAAGARTQAEALVNLTDPSALTGMTATKKSQVINFRIP